MATTEDELRDVQARLYGRQARWEMPKAVAMILLASAAISASARLADYIHPPQPMFPSGTVITIPGGRP